MSHAIEPLKVGKADVKLSTPSHVRGVQEGNKGRTETARGFKRVRGALRGDARRSTGICPDAREPIDPRMPRLSPA